MNDKIKQHNRGVFSAQSQRHVAEQIDALYWNEVVDQEEEAALEDVIIKKEADLTDADAVQSLPGEQNDLYLHADHAASAEHVEAYQKLRNRLLTLTAQRDEKRKKLAQYQQLQRLLVPFEDPQTNIQPNLVTRDGELGKELDRMRVLLARVTSRVREARPRDPASATPNPISSAQKVAQIMDMT